MDCLLQTCLVEAGVCSKSRFYLTLDEICIMEFHIKDSPELLA